MENSKRDLTPKYVFGMSTFLYFVAAGIGGVAGFAISLYTKSGDGVIYWSVLICNLLLIPFFISLCNRAGLNKLSLKINLFEWKHISLGIIATVLLMVGAMNAFDFFSIDTKELEYWSMVSKNANIFLAILSTGIVGPILEELYFRGIIYGTVRHYKGYLLATLVSSALFAVGHGTVLYMIIGFIVGIVLSTVYELTRNLWVPIAVHMFNNLISCFEDSLNGNMFSGIEMSNAVLIVTAIGAFIIVCIIMFFECRKAKNESKLQWIE